MTSVIRLRIEGAVQGVGFRAFVRREAGRLALEGWVRNRLDGTVEVLAKGPREKLDALVRACESGPSAARVTKVHVTAANEDPGAGFTQYPTA